MGASLRPSPVIVFDDRIRRIITAWLKWEQPCRSLQYHQRYAPRSFCNCESITGWWLPKLSPYHLYRRSAQLRQAQHSVQGVYVVPHETNLLSEM